MESSRFIFITVLLVLFIVPSVLAGSISITVTATSSVIIDSALLNVSLQNNGDEAAEDVRLSLLLPEDFVSDDVFIGRLGPGLSWSGLIPVNTTDGILSGTYPAVVLLHYRDANGYPFSSVSQNTIIYKEASYSDISGTIKSVGLVEDGKLNIVIRNLGNNVVDAKVNLYLPLEITADEYEKAIRLGAKSEEDISFEISNFGAIAGSVYYVLASIEHDDGRHYSSFATGIVEIKEKEEVVGFDNTWLIAIVLILLAAFILYQFIGRRSHEKKIKSSETKEA